MVKFIASFFPKRNPAFERNVTPTQALIASGVVFIAAAWPMLTLRLGRPASWFGEFLFLLCASVSVLAAPSMCLATLIDIVRGKVDVRLLLAFALSLAGVAAISAF